MFIWYNMQILQATHVCTNRIDEAMQSITTQPIWQEIYFQ